VESKLLKKKSIEKILLAAAKGKEKVSLKPPVLSDAERKFVIEWAERVRIDSDCLNLVLKGALLMYIDGLKIRFTLNDEVLRGK
jgi:hypothetical protein